MKYKDMFIDLDNIDVETIERIEFKYETGKEPYAIVYHVYKHRGTFLTKVSVEEAENYLEEDENLLRSYSYNDSSVSKEQYYMLISNPESNVKDEVSEEKVVVEKTDEEKKDFSDEVLRNVHKKQLEEEKEKQKKYSIFRNDEKKKEEIRVSKPDIDFGDKKVKTDSNIFMKDEKLRDLIDKAWGISVEEKEENAKTDKISEEEKITSSVNDSTSKLNGVVVYTAINRNNQIVNRAMMIYSDGTIKNVSQKIFTEEIAKEARKRGYSDYNKLVDDKFLVFTTVELMVRDWDKYFGEDSKVVNNTQTASVPLESNASKKQPKAEANNRKESVVAPVKNNTTKSFNNNVLTPSSVNGNNTSNTKPVSSSTPVVAPVVPNKSSKTTKTKKKGVLSRIGGFFKRHIGPVVAVLVAGALAITGINAIKKLKDRNNNEKPSTSYSQMDDSTSNRNKNTDTNTNDNDLSAINALDNLKDKNDLRYQFLKDTTKDLNKYNSEFANQYYEAAKGTRLAHSFDETISEYIAYNNISDEELSIIFGNDKLDSKVLTKNFKNAVKEDGQLHNLQTHSVTRNDLFNTQEGRDFYKKYSDLFTSMNKANVNETKVEKLEKFYDMLRNDFDFSTIPSGKDSYKLSILEYVSAAQNMDVNVKLDNELTDSEKAYFDKLYSSVEEKFDSISNSQNAKTNNGSDTNLQVSDYKSLIEDYLKSQNIYDLSNRDVSNYDSYKAHTVIRVLTNTNEEEKQSTNTNVDTIYLDDNYDYGNVYVDDNDYGETELVIGDDDTDLTIGDDDTDLTIGDGETELVIGDDDNTSTYTIETEEGTSELTIDTENNTAEIVLDDFITGDEEVSLDDYAAEDSSETVETQTIYIDGVLDSDGKLSDNYKITTNGEGAVSKDTELPDPNKITDEQLEAMMLAYSGNTNVNETPKVLKLR